jgi:hypothetical protein
MKRKFFILLLTVIFFAGCSGDLQSLTKTLNKSLGIPNSKEDIIKIKTDDPYLTKIMADYYGKKNIKNINAYKNGITIQKTIINFDDNIPQYSLKEKIFDWYDNSQIINKYKQAIIKRGDIFKVYNNNLALLVNRVLTFNNPNTEFQTFDGHEYHYFNLSPLIIEYNKNNEIISVCLVDYIVNVAFNQFQDQNAPVNVQANIQFYFKKAGKIRNFIGNNKFNDALIYSSGKANLSINNVVKQDTINTDSNTNISNNNQIVQTKLKFIKKLHDQGILSDKQYKESVQKIIDKYTK